MQMLQTVLLVLQVIVAVSLIGFILIQHGKGADAGAAFGSGASATVFGSRGSGNFLTRATTILAVIFLANSLFLSYLALERIKSQQSVMADSLPPVSAPAELPEPVTATVPDPVATDSDVPALPEE